MNTEDIVDTDSPRAVVNLPSPAELYDRWEQQQWSVADLKVEQDSARWTQFKPFVRRELLTALADLEIGEVSVTQTLSSLVDHAPSEEDRIYLCTQMADEGRHVQFFKQYLLKAVGVTEGDLAPDGELGMASAYGNIFEPTLREATRLVREHDGDRPVWYAGVVWYHLITEGVLAAAGLKSLRAFVRSVGELPALEVGLANVTRDETRHLTYGLSAAREGVTSGYADIIAETYRAGIDKTVEVLVNPRQRALTPMIPVALAKRAEQLTEQWNAARGRVVRQLGLIGLGEHRAEAEQRFDAALERTLDHYHEVWGVQHPVRRAAASGLINA
ncbi:hypothetical protein OG562_24000 [Streptomyces sp. NBC_01275]|uniref:hypothetical protein n=1 Tax=Streptomyces sp. NBC_01275 TaxID=2903807 RepID=UPI00225884A4|nr:hypothetical protein [Streptomyces sp. NBC_01275]MCX4763968.1 hypothetical protein [Streptomyces sp. NBC_01275]